MLRTRVVPALLIRGSGLVKTVRFKNPQYVGDAINSARIFNEMEVDELLLFDIDASVNGTGVRFELVDKVVSECFMPISYGGGVKSIEDFSRLYHAGVEKVSVSSLLFEDPDTVKSAVGQFGSQSVVATLDVRWSRLKRRYLVCTHNGRRVVAESLDAAIQHVNHLQVGEIVVNNIDRDGTWMGFDNELVAHVSARTEAPVVALGGAGSMSDIRDAVESGAAAVALGSMAVYQSRGMGVLINFPNLRELEELLG